MASACDSCVQPGSCCKGFTLSSGSDGALHAAWDGLDAVKRLQDLGLPFIPIKVIQKHETEEGRRYYVFSYGCPHLGEDGRCGIYESRPQLCKDYEPLSSKLCTMYVEPNNDT